MKRRSFLAMLGLAPFMPKALDNFDTVTVLSPIDTATNPCLDYPQPEYRRDHEGNWMKAYAKVLKDMGIHNEAVDRMRADYRRLHGRTDRHTP